MTKPPSTSLGPPLWDAYDLIILDLDGVVYLGPQAVPGAAQTVRAAQELGITYCYLTNNASRTAVAIAEHLLALGLPATTADILTSAQVAARMLGKALPPGTPVLVIGGAGLTESLHECGLIPITTYDDPLGPPQAVVQGFSPDLTWRDLAEGTRGVRAGLPWTATNLDATFPTEYGPAPGNGSLVRAVATAAGRSPDQVAGKPAAAPFREAVARYEARRPLVVGDRLDTDIEGAVNAGMDSLAVLTGVSGVTELLHAPPGLRPTYICASVAGLQQPYPAVTVAADAAHCGSVRVVASEGLMRVVSQGRPIDVLRAGCALTWQSHDRGQPLNTSELESALSSIRDVAGWEQPGAIP